MVLVRVVLGQVRAERQERRRRDDEVDRSVGDLRELLEHVADVQRDIAHEEPFALSTFV
jgi:hypothetical protein